MIDLHRELPAHGFATRMILTVHDELLFEGPAAEATAASAFVRERMEGVASLAVPLTVDVGFADNWRDAKP
jgi:DNA polymerase-1